MKQKKKQNLSDKEKEEIYDHLVELVRTLDKKENYKYHGRDDPDYYGIRDIYLMMMMMIITIIIIIIIMIMITTTQYQSKVLLKIIANIMKAKVIKTKNYQ